MRSPIFDEALAAESEQNIFRNYQIDFENSTSQVVAIEIVKARFQTIDIVQRLVEGIGPFSQSQDLLIPIWNKIFFSEILTPIPKA